MSISQISVVIIAKNAEETISECLSAIKSFNNVVLYLNNSEDKTAEIASSYGNVQIVDGDFLGFGRTKNRASSYAKHPWILSLDSDEILTPELIEELDKIKLEEEVILYRLRRDNYFLGYKTQSQDIITRLYNKRFTTFNDNDVHEKIMHPKNAKVYTLNASFKHLNITDINQTLRKIIHYTDLGSKGQRTCFFMTVIAKSMFAFFKTYILQGNFLKGWVGYVLAVNSANKRYYKYLKQYINCQDWKKKS